jgi:hypothetical protein
MVFYTTTGTAPSGLTNNTTYFVSNFSQQGTSTIYTFSLKTLPTAPFITTISGGTGTHTFTQIGVSIDRDVFHIQNHGYVANDMLRYDYPAGGKFGVVSIDQDKEFYFVSQVLDNNNFTLNQVIGELVPSTDARTGTNAGTAITPTSVTAVGFGAGLTYAVTSGTLPAGLNLNASTGVVSGTPSAAYSTANVTITATDSSGTQGSQVITFQFNPAPNLYNFTSATFGTGGAEGRFGPNITQARSAVGQPAWTGTYLNMSTNGKQIWTVPETSTYRFIVIGSQGQNGSPGRGGYGARMQATVALTQGETLELGVGQRNNNTLGYYESGGGGGGSWVRRTGSAAPLIVAGGGGGGGSSWYGYEGSGYSGAEASTVGNGNATQPNSPYAGEDNTVATGGAGGYSGTGGGLSYNGVAGGGGWTGNGQDGNNSSEGGRALYSGSAVGGNATNNGNNLGGFGGGGGSRNVAGAGGGGYSGGNGAYWGGNPTGGGGGGGSFIGAGVTLESGTSNTSGGQGSISVTRI